jgi:hypothetical protein
MFSTNSRNCFTNTNHGNHHYHFGGTIQRTNLGGNLEDHIHGEAGSRTLRLEISATGIQPGLVRSAGTDVGLLRVGLMRLVVVAEITGCGDETEGKRGEKGLLCLLLRGWSFP